MTQAKKGIWRKGQWPIQNGVEDHDVALMARKDAITQFNILEHESKTFYVTLTCAWRTDLLYLTTQREPEEPKLFKDLDRLAAHIKNEYPTIRNIALILNRRSVDNRGVKVKIERRGVRPKAAPQKRPSAPV